MMATNNQNRVEVGMAAMQQFLQTVGFESIAKIGHSLAYRHRESGAVVTLTAGEHSGTVRPADFLSIKFRLESEGLVTDEAVAELNQGRLPIAS